MLNVERLSRNVCLTKHKEAEGIHMSDEDSYIFVSSKTCAIRCTVYTLKSWDLNQNVNDIHKHINRIHGSC